MMTFFKHIRAFLFGSAAPAAAEPAPASIIAPFKKRGRPPGSSSMTSERRARQQEIVPQITPLKDCPATRAIEAFGGDLKVFAEAVGRHQTRVYRWTLSRKDGGTGGLIPAQVLARVLAEAEKRGHELTADDLIGDVQ